MSAEAHRSFACFGGTASVHVMGRSSAEGEKAADDARRRLLDAHHRLSRFIEDSELMRLNRDPRLEVPATPLLRRLAGTVRTSAAISGGLVDATLLDRIEEVGYRDSMEGSPPPSVARDLRRRQAAVAGPHPAARWREIHIDAAAGTIARPPGLRIDSGGIAKGLVADLVAGNLRDLRSYAVDCCGDIRIGGAARRERVIRIGDPFGGGPIEAMSLREGAVATTGITRRCWIGPGEELRHHLLDPRTGSPAFTGVAQVTAIAPLGVLAETYAKAALLSGPERAQAWLPYGGVVVLDTGEIHRVRPRRRPRQGAPAR